VAAGHWWPRSIRTDCRKSPSTVVAVVVVVHCDNIHTSLRVNAISTESVIVVPLPVSVVHLIVESDSSSTSNSNWWELECDWEWASETSLQQEQ